MKAQASIVIPVFNQLAYTKECVSSLLDDDDRPPYELIIVDNASTDGTRDYLDALQQQLDRSADRLVTVLNETNLGVAPAWNQGLRAATAPTIAILNNDIVLTRGWYRSLLWAMELHGLGMVSPFAVCGERNYPLEERASRFSERNLAKLWPDYDFCAVMLKRSTVEKVGFFDENFRVGGWEDTDYAFRLKRADIRYGVSGAALIHHYGSRTLGGFKVAGDRHAPGNHAYFVQKWNTDPAAESARFCAKLRRTVRRWKLNWDFM